MHSAAEAQINKQQSEKIINQESMKQYTESSYYSEALPEGYGSELARKRQSSVRVPAKEANLHMFSHQGVGYFEIIPDEVRKSSLSPFSKDALIKRAGSTWEIRADVDEEGNKYNFFVERNDVEIKTSNVRTAEVRTADGSAIATVFIKAMQPILANKGNEGLKAAFANPSETAKQMPQAAKDQLVAMVMSDPTFQKKVSDIVMQTTQSTQPQPGAQPGAPV